MAVVRITDGKGGCCNCAEQTGCSCGSNPCGLQCQVQSGIADICGFPKFTSDNPPTAADDPPVAYYSKSISGSMAIGEGPSLSQQPCDNATNPNSWSANATCQSLGCVCGVFSYSATLKPTGPGSTPGTVNYVATISSACGSTPATAQISGLFKVWNDGDTHDIGIGAYARPTVFLALCTFVDCVGDLGTNVYVSDNTVPQFNDTWSANASYDSGTCAFTSSDTSSRDYDDNILFPSGGGTPVGSPPGNLFTGPSYGGPCFSQIVSGENERTTSGTNACFADGYPTLGSGYAIAEGTITENMSSESTAGDAVARAISGGSYSPAPNCSVGTSFITPYSYSSSNPFSFGFQKAQTRACVSGLVIGHTYQVTIGIYQRVLGSGGTYEPSGNIVLTITADAASDCTPWQDIPLSYGIETMAGSCSVVAL